MADYGVAGVREFTADLKNRMDNCDNGEGMDCASLDDALKNYAIVCCEFREKVRKWGREVFAGRVAFDPEVDKILHLEGYELFVRAFELARNGREAEVPCYILDAQTGLDAALWNLHLLLENWVSPRLAVGPAARQGLLIPEHEKEQVRQRIGALSPLPSDWYPASIRQRVRFRKPRIRRDS